MRSAVTIFWVRSPNMSQHFVRRTILSRLPGAAFSQRATDSSARAYPRAVSMALKPASTAVEMSAFASPPSSITGIAVPKNMRCAGFSTPLMETVLLII